MSSGIKNPNATYPYQGENWPTDSYWHFRVNQIADDRDAASAMTSKSVLKRTDRKEIKRIIRDGGSIEDYIEEHTDTQTMMSAEKALLAIMGVKVEGEYFTIPADYEDENGKTHALAGKVIPQPPSRQLKQSDPKQYQAQLEQHIKWIGLLDADDRSEAMEFMTAVWAGRSPEDMKRFPKSGGGVDKSADRTKREGRGGVSSGAQPVLSS